MIECAVDIDGRFVYAMRADGIIVATPTGSTAYALSAGGPILDPKVPALALVPVAPHALTYRPIAVAETSVITITVAAWYRRRRPLRRPVAFPAGRRRARRRSAARRIRRGSCIRKATTISRCCARSCTGARRRNGCGRSNGTPGIPDAARAVDSQFRRRRGARRRIRPRLLGADRRNRRRQVDPARCAVAAAGRPFRVAAVASRRGSGPNSRPSSTSPMRPGSSRGSASTICRPTTARCCCAACSTRRASRGPGSTAGRRRSRNSPSSASAWSTCTARTRTRRWRPPTRSARCSTRSAASRHWRAKPATPGAPGARRPKSATRRPAPRRRRPRNAICSTSATASLRPRTSPPPNGRNCRPRRPGSRMRPR